MLGCRTGNVTMTTQPYFEAFSAEKVPVVVNFIFFFFCNFAGALFVFEQRY